MLQEQHDLQMERPAARPPDIAQSLIATPEHLDAKDLLQKIKEVWSIVAGWGRWSDEDLGEWPSSDQCLRDLPEWFAMTIQSVPHFEFENWLQDLHDRNWTWWSGAILDDHIKIDLNVTSRPASFWMLHFVIEKCGAVVIYNGEWTDRL
jgi:hypothetical protein